MSLTAALSRISQLEAAFAAPAATPAPVAAPPAAAATSSTLTRAPAGAPAFASYLAGAQPTAPTAAPADGATNAGRAALAVAEREVGVTEQPPGSNDGARIAQYRKATAGSGVGPWCAYFVSWAAREAGAPLGDAGQGFGRVDDVWAWAQRTGKATPAGPGVKPRPGDLIVWDEHIGIVESVDGAGRIHTVEGNSSNSVTKRDYGPDGGGAVGYVRLG